MHIIQYVQVVKSPVMVYEVLYVLQEDASAQCHHHKRNLPWPEHLPEKEELCGQNEKCCKVDGLIMVQLNQ